MFSHVNEDFFKLSQDSPSYAQGISDLKKGNYAQAILAFQSAFKELDAPSLYLPENALLYHNYCVDSAKIYLSLVQTHLAQKNGKEAKENAGEASRFLHHAIGSSWSLKTDKAIIHYCSGLCLQLMGQTKDAIEAFKEVVRLNPKHFDACYRLGILITIADDPSDAAIYLKMAVEINPLHADAHYQLGVVWKNSRPLTPLTSAIIQKFKRVVALDPQHANAHYQLATLYYIESDLATAILLCRKALEINPTHEETCAILKEILNNNTPGFFNKVKKIDLYRTIKMLPSKDQIPLLIASLNRGTELSEHFYKPRIPGTSCSPKKGILKMIGKQLAYLRAEMLSEALPHYRLGKNLFRYQHNKQQARLEFKKALEKRPNDDLDDHFKLFCAKIYLGLGKTYQLDKQKKAIKYFKQALKSLDGCSDKHSMLFRSKIYLHLAKAYPDDNAKEGNYLNLSGKQLENLKKSSAKVLYQDAILMHHSYLDSFMVSDLKKLRKKNPYHVKTNFRLGLFHRGQCERVRIKGDIGLYGVFASFSYTKEARNKAIKKLQKVLASRPYSVDAHYQLAMLYVGGYDLCFRSEKYFSEKSCNEDVKDQKEPALIEKKNGDLKLWSIDGRGNWQETILKENFNLQRDQGNKHTVFVSPTSNKDIFDKLNKGHTNPDLCLSEAIFHLSQVLENNPTHEEAAALLNDILYSEIKDFSSTKGADLFVAITKLPLRDQYRLLDNLLKRKSALGIKKRFSQEDMLEIKDYFKKVKIQLKIPELEPLDMNEDYVQKTAPRAPR